MEKKIVDYDILVTTGLGMDDSREYPGVKELVSVVRDKLAEGWQPYGPIRRYDADPHQVGYCYIQAIVKYSGE